MRLSKKSVNPELFEAVLNLEMKVRASGIDKKLLHLIKARASQINHCAYCIDMHMKEARAGGESEERLYLLSAWREAPQFTAKERAALAWTETVALLADTNVPDYDWEAVRKEYSEAEVANLTLAIATSNRTGNI